VDPVLTQTLQQLTAALLQLTTTLERLDATMVTLVHDMGTLLTINIGIAAATLLTTVTLWWHGLRYRSH